MAKTIFQNNMKGFHKMSPKDSVKKGRPVRCGALCRDRLTRAAPMIYSSSWGPVELGRKRDVTESYAMTHMQWSHPTEKRKQNPAKPWPDKPKLCTGGVAHDTSSGVVCLTIDNITKSYRWLYHLHGFQSIKWWWWWSCSSRLSNLTFYFGMRGRCDSW